MNVYQGFLQKLYQRMFPKPSHNKRQCILVHQSLTHRFVFIRLETSPNVHLFLAVSLYNPPHWNLTLPYPYLHQLCIKLFLFYRLLMGQTLTFWVT